MDKPLQKQLPYVRMLLPCFFIFWHFLGISLCHGQKLGYIDSQFVLEQLPEYKEAEATLDSLSVVWQSEIEEKYKEIERMELLLQNERILLTGELIGEREESIKEKQQAAKAYQQETFGFEGLYFQKQKVLIQEIQDLVFRAVESVAKKKKLQIVFDKSGDLVMMYTNPIHDYTEYVIEELAMIKEEDKKRSLASGTAEEDNTSADDAKEVQKEQRRPPNQATGNN